MQDRRSKVLTIMFYIQGLFLALFFFSSGAYIFFLLLLVLWIYLLFLERKGLKEFFSEPLLLPLWGFFALSVISGLWAPDTGLWLNYAAKDLHYLLYFLIVLYLFRRMDNYQLWVKGFLLAGILLIGYGLYEYGFLATSSRYRLSSLYGNSNHFAGALGLLLPFFFAVFLDKDFSWKYRIGSLGILLGGIICVYGSQSRSVWLALPLGLILVAFLRNIKTGIAVSLVLLLAFGIFFPMLPDRIQDRASSIFSIEANRSRVNLWVASYMMFKDNPVAGAGRGSFVAVSSDYLSQVLEREVAISHTNPHNLWFFTAAELGFLGLFWVTLFCLLVLKKGLINLKNIQREFWIKAGTMGGLGTLFIHLLTDYIITIRAIAMVAFFLIALLARTAEDNFQKTTELKAEP